MLRKSALLRRSFSLIGIAVAVWCLIGWPLFASGNDLQMRSIQALPQSGRALELKDYYRIESADSPAISPDGRLVAFARSYIVEAENRRHSEIWLVHADGASAPIRITNPAFSSSNPRWSPDGKLLTFNSRRKVPNESEDAGSVWFLRMDQPGGEAFQIAGVTGSPIFSPDNQWIAFTKRTPPEAKSKKQYASDFERLIHERFKGRMHDWMDYRFDGRGYLPDPRDSAATPPEELYIVPRQGGTPKQITRLGVNVQSAAWRPDSLALVVEANAHQRDEYTYERADLWVVTLDGQTRRLTDDGYNHSAPAWSSDGRSIVFRREQGLSMIIGAKQNHGSPVDLFRIQADGGEMKNLTADWDLLPGPPVCSADGRYVYFSGGIGGNSHLFRVASTGGAVEQVTQGDRSLAGFSISKAFDRLAYAAVDSTHPSEIFSALTSGAGEKKLTNINGALLNEVQLSRAERILYPSKDGTQIEGWVVLPRGYDPAKGSYPLILSIHGGPHGAYGNSFSFQFQLWAASGYVVVYTNPRGSTGYGEKFLWATWGGWGILDYDDVMAGVEHVVKRYKIDEKRMGVTGYSYGGFLTNWVITHTDRFAAAISGAGISNWISDYGTADIPRTKESEFFGPPWEPKSNELLTKLSPIYYAGNVKTPTMFIHGESDLRVPIEQAEQMYTALKKRRVPARFIRYPDSYHGGWTPWNMVHRYYHELKWWEQYLAEGSRNAIGSRQ
ncbi:MAG TPA: S9 family peptidase [Blastocatellia bacterium]|nr:S9 family peptidase [Blastocatellia bacterium]